MNLLVGHMRLQLTELELGISGALNITEGMEKRGPDSEGER